MAYIKINNIPQSLIDKIDSLVKQSNCHDRSAFLVAALEDYCLYHDKYFLHCLPDTTRILSEDVMQKLKEHDAETFNYSIKTIENSNLIIKQLCDILSGDNDIEADDKGDNF